MLQKFCMQGNTNMFSIDGHKNINKNHTRFIWNQQNHQGCLQYIWNRRKCKQLNGKYECQQHKIKFLKARASNNEVL